MRYRHYISIALAALFAQTAFLAGPGFAQSTTVNNPLGSLISKKRPLLLFAKSRSDASHDRQISILREFRSELDERDMVVLQIAGTEEPRVLIGYVSLDRGSNRDLRRKYLPTESGLTVVLIGKDGEEKKRWTQVVNPEDIFAVIDAMPMRQQEIKMQVVN